jgi:predicted RNA-binding protein with RPS1 domain
MQGTVLALGPYGAKVQITDHIRALVPMSHLADVELKNPKKKIKEGQVCVVRCGKGDWVSIRTVLEIWVVLHVQCKAPISRLCLNW